MQQGKCGFTTNPLASDAARAAPSTTATSARGNDAFQRQRPSTVLPALSGLPRVWQPLAQETRQLRTTYRYLYKLPVVEYADGSRSFHDGLLYRCHGLNVLLLRGDFVEMAFQHA